MNQFEDKLIVELEDIFDGLAKQTLEVQKKKLGLSGDLDHQDYEKLIEQIKLACQNLVGQILAEDAYARLRNLLKEQWE